jgi:hypothetical protein
MQKPKPTAYDFLMGHRFCTYDAQGRASMHTNSEVSAMRDNAPWAYDWERKRWIKKPEEELATSH